ncbi:MAG: thiamine pyrophosphate-dependent dehydrogenase E1 component subunit alpha [Dehalococcoidales bacterium]|nr:thiamine pyrophosphate-dependent dehydrogenase E1 component subunit alpha [Dehalococcoidales bacterium]
MAVPNEKLLEMYRNVLTARRVGEKLYELFSSGKSGIPWLHRGIGEEAIPIAVLANLRKDDYVKLTFRMDYCLFAKGIEIRDCIASEAYKDSSQFGGPRSRFFWPEKGMLGHTGAGGEDPPIYLGAAVSIKYKKTDQVVVCVMGDGFGNRGPMHESMVMAASWKLPIVFMIHNNQYGMNISARRDGWMVNDLADRGKGYGLPGESVDGNDVIATYEVVKKYVDLARNGGGPSFIVGETYRLGGHTVGDTQPYRPKGEAEEWWKLDPLPRYQKTLMDMGILTKEMDDRFEAEIKAEVDKAGEDAIALPFASLENHLKTAIDVV